jgi:hypothetical protein
MHSSKYSWVSVYLKPYASKDGCYMHLIKRNQTLSLTPNDDSVVSQTTHGKKKCKHNTFLNPYSSQYWKVC